MKPLGVLIVAALALLVAPRAWAQAPTCKTVQYSDTVVEALPDVRDLCLRVEERDGKEFAVVKAEVSRVHRQNTLEVRFKRPDGSKSEPRVFQTAPDRRIMVQGKSMRVQDVAVGQELTAFIHVKTPEIATEPAGANEALEPVPFEKNAPTQP